MKIIEGKTFKDLTTFHIGGKIKYYAEVKNKKEIDEVFCFAKKNNLKIFIIGGGSNLLAGDSEFDGLVIKYIGQGISYLGEGKIKAEAGANWDSLVKFAVDKNLQGIECLSGIPGTVGACPIQNIGAYGAELKDTFDSLTAYDIDKEKFVRFERSDCKFGYRESIFKEKSHWQKYLILDVTLKLNENTKPVANYESLKGYINENPSLADVRNAILQVREIKLEDPSKAGNAGSFFKNPVISLEQKDRFVKEFPGIKTFSFDGRFKIPAAWLIEQAGWKGKSHKSTAVSGKHALFLLNVKGDAKAGDVFELSEMIIKDVKEKFDVILEREVQLINFQNE